MMFPITCLFSWSRRVLRWTLWPRTLSTMMPLRGDGRRPVSIKEDAGGTLLVDGNAMRLKAYRRDPLMVLAMSYLYMVYSS